MFVYNNISSRIPSEQDVLSLLIDHDIDMMIVGSSVAKYHGLLENAQDIDLLLNDSENNKKKLYLFLKQFFDITSINDIFQLQVLKLLCKNNKIIDLFIDGTELESSCLGKIHYNILLENSIKSNFNNLVINMMKLKDYINCLSFVIECLEKQNYNKNGIPMYNKVEKYKNILKKYAEQYTL